jgi:glutamine phosphoribosylpyrophosphate amidotransferase
MPIKYDIDTTNQKEVILQCILGDGDIEELIQRGKIYYSSFVDLINYTKNAKFWANFLERKVSIKTCANILAEKDIRENVLLDILDYLSIDRISEAFNVENFSLEIMDIHILQMEICM